MDIEAEREDRLARVLSGARREATVEGRIAAVSLTLLPVLVGVVLVTFEPNAQEAIQTDTGISLLLGASALTVLGAVWLWQLAKPPFGLRPGRCSIFERQPQTGYEMSLILRRATEYADDGMEVADALLKAAPSDDEQHPARVLALALRVLHEPATSSDRTTKEEQVGSGNDGSIDAAREALPPWFLDELHPAWTERDPQETLKRVTARLAEELEGAAQRWPTRVRVAALVPFFVCIVPAVGLLAVLVFS